MACKYYNVTINQQDLNNAVNNTDSELDGKVFVSYTDCNGSPESIAYSTAGTYPNAFCADPSESITAFYWNEDLGNLTFSSFATEGGNCVAPTPRPSTTPSISISPTPSTTPLFTCNCISFTNTTNGALRAGYTSCNGSATELLIQPNSSVIVCGSNPSGGAGISISVLGNCVGNRCIPFTPTPTPSLSITPSISVTPSITPSKTPSISITPSRTPSISITPSRTPSNTVPPSMTPTPTISVSKTPSLTPLPSVSKTPSISVTPSRTPSTGVSPTPTPSLSTTGSIPTVAGLCMNIQFGAAPSITPSISVSRTPSVTPSVTPSITPSITPSNTNPPPTPSRTPSRTPSISVSVTPSITPSITTSISITPSISISTTPSITPTPSLSTGADNPCNTVLYKTQGNQYYSYNFTTNTSTLLNVPVAPYDSVATSLEFPISSLTHTSDKLWSYTWNNNAGNLNDNSIIEYNITSNPFTATINRYIALPGGNLGTVGTFKPAKGLVAISNTKLIGVVANIGNVTLASVYLPGNPSGYQAANGMNVVEYDITTNEATWELKLKLFPYEQPIGGMLLTSDDKLIILTKAFPSEICYISQYNYNTGIIEYRAPLTPTITTDCGLAQINGEIYIMGYNVYKFNTTTFELTLTQSPQTQLVDSSQLLNCINTNLPTSSCPECKTLPLKISETMVYNGITISPTYTGVIGDPTLAVSPGARDNIYPGNFFGCYGSNVVAHPSYSLWAGNTNPATPYTYSLNFSEPVNNIKLLYNGTNADPTQRQYETFIWDTNGGTPNISLCEGCGQTINGNIISGTSGPELWPGVPQSTNFPQYTTGGGTITISSPLNFTTLTLRSPGGNSGTVFSICSSSITPQPANALGCVYYSNGSNTYLYNINNNTSTQVTLPTDTFNSFAETHTLTKYWKGNQTNTIKEWIPTSIPNILELNRTINVSGITSAFGNYFTLLVPVNDTTLLTTIIPVFNTCDLVLMDITDTNVTAGDLTTLFTFADQFVDSMLLTSNNKLITIGRTSNDLYLTQYSYPTGTQEVRTNITSIGVTSNNNTFYLFESNGSLYFSKQFPYPTSIIYQINLNYPYEITEIYDNLNLFGASYNSSTNCNTVALNPPPPEPSMSPTPTPSLTPPVSPNVGVNTIYKYLDIL